MAVNKTVERGKVDDLKLSMLQFGFIRVEGEPLIFRMLDHEIIDAETEEVLYYEVLQGSHRIAAVTELIQEGVRDKPGFDSVRAIVKSSHNISPPLRKRNFLVISR